MPTTKATDRSKRAQDSERAQDRAVEDTFPASDPPARSGITGAEGAAQSRNTGTSTGTEQDEPKGSPTSDRHATETAHHREPDVKPPAHKPS